MECESPILQETAGKLADIHEEFDAIQEEQMRSVSSNLGMPDRSPEKSWKWTGSCFVKSPTVEPWVKLTVDCLNLFILYFKCVQ